MIKIERQQDCCGCTACEQVCHKHAITMIRDIKGFTYPNVDIKLCDKCGICDKTCPILNEREPRIPAHTYALKHNNENIRQKSSSGGAFSILANNTLTNDGVVCGAEFDHNWNVVHTMIDSSKHLSKLMGSKYVQSNLNDIFRQVKKKLQEGIPVLFSGTPCQVAGLLNYLGRIYPNLTTVDFVCHGVPSPRIWQDYLSEILIDKKNKKKHISSSSSKKEETLSHISFRDKSKGWKKYHLVINSRNKTSECSNTTLVDEYIWDNDYMLAFLEDYINRPSCHECHFRNGKSGSDYTIGDYWGIDKLYPDFFDDNGISMLLSYNGELPEYVKKNTEYLETTFDDACFGNPCIKNSWPIRPASRCFFFMHIYLGCSIHDSLKKTMLIEKYCRNIKANAKKIRIKIREI